MKISENDSKNLDNHWIIKAWNLAHGTSTKIVKSLAEIMTMRKTLTPYTISKYIERPFLERLSDSYFCHHLNFTPTSLLPHPKLGFPTHPNLTPISPKSHVDPKFGSLRQSEPTKQWKPTKIQNENGQVKFDFRYHVIVKSYRPLEAYVMKRFWPKLASEEYDLEVRSYCNTIF